jgi:hypothetical protein
MEPDWFGNPKHFLTGGLLAAAVALLAPRLSIHRPLVVVVLAVGVTMTMEAIVELVEYPLKYDDDPNLTAYYDTLADLAGSLAGSVVGAVAVVVLRARRRGSAQRS